MTTLASEHLFSLMDKDEYVVSSSTSTRRLKRRGFSKIVAGPALHVRGFGDLVQLQSSSV